MRHLGLNSNEYNSATNNDINMNPSHKKYNSASSGWYVMHMAISWNQECLE